MHLHHPLQQLLAGLQKQVSSLNLCAWIVALVLFILSTSVSAAYLFPTAIVAMLYANGPFSVVSSFPRGFCWMLEIFMLETWNSFELRCSPVYLFRLIPFMFCSTNSSRWMGCGCSSTTGSGYSSHYWRWCSRRHLGLRKFWSSQCVESFVIG